MREGTILSVVGVTFHQEAVRKMSVGDNVFLKHDAANEHDANAMAVVNQDGETLGHLPRALAPRFSVVEAGGDPDCVWAATVSDLTHYEATVGLRLRLGRQIQPFAA